MHGRIAVIAYVIVVVRSVPGPQANHLPHLYGVFGNNPDIGGVLSPSTERADRGLKFDCYRTLESIRAYVLVSQEEPRI